MCSYRPDSSATVASATAENCLSDLGRSEVHAELMYGADVDGRQPAQLMQVNTLLWANSLPLQHGTDLPGWLAKPRCRLPNRYVCNRTGCPVLHGLVAAVSAGCRLLAASHTVPTNTDRGGASDRKQRLHCYVCNVLKQVDAR